MRYMRALNDWLDRDVRDRQSELHGISARVDHLHQDLAQMAMHTQAPGNLLGFSLETRRSKGFSEVPVIPQEEGRPVISPLVPVPQYIPSPFQGYPGGFRSNNQGPVILPCIPSIFPPIIPPVTPPPVIPEHTGYTGRTPSPPHAAVYPGRAMYSGSRMPRPGAVSGPYPGAPGWGTPRLSMRRAASAYSAGSSVVIPGPVSPAPQPPAEGAGTLDKTHGASTISRAHSEDVPFSGADATIMADAFRKALRKPEFAGGQLEEGDASRTHTHGARSRQRATLELTLVDGGRPDIITATVKTAAVKGKPARPKRARTALASLFGK
jgi:hypothetical protein